MAIEELFHLSDKVGLIEQNVSMNSLYIESRRRDEYDKQ
jgi:hypothetical protein